MDNYRKCVAAIIINNNKKIFIAKRSNLKNAWQFPQGGVEKNESHKKALFREVKEEIGVKKKLLKIIDSKKGYTYFFPKNHSKFGDYLGQKQKYYLLNFKGNNNDIDITADPHKEFSKYKWIYPDEFDINWLPNFKRKVYQKIFNDFFNLKI